MSNINTVLVLGAGVMGRGIAQHLACSDIKTIVYSRTQATLDKCRSQIEDSLASRAAQGYTTKTDNDGVHERISYVTDMAAHAPGADLVIETLSEKLNLKRRVFKELDALCPPETILATNTSSFDIDDIAEAAEKHPERVLGMHWFHPPDITPGIEMISGMETSPEIFKEVENFCLTIGKKPTRCANVPGFVANRIQMAMAAEAINIVSQGLASPREVDAIIRSTIGFRLGAFGPFEIADMAGADTYLAIMQYMREKYGWRNEEAISFLTSQVEKGRLGLKAGKGFYYYDEQAVERTLRQRDSFLLRRLNVFNLENCERD